MVLLRLRTKKKKKTSTNDIIRRQLPKDGSCPIILLNHINTWNPTLGICNYA